MASHYYLQGVVPDVCCVDRFLGCLNQLSPMWLTFARARSFLSTDMEILLDTYIYTTFDSSSGHKSNVSTIQNMDIFLMCPFVGLWTFWMCPVCMILKMLVMCIAFVLQTHSYCVEHLKSGQLPNVSTIQNLDISQMCPVFRIFPYP